MIHLLMFAEYLEMSNTQFNNVDFLYRAKPSNQILTQENKTNNKE